MKKKTNIWLMLVIALILGTATFFLTQTYLKNKEKEIQGAYKPNVAKTIKVIVAVGPIRKGDILKASMVAPVEYPAEFVVKGAISPENASGYFGQVSHVPMKRGQIVYSSYLGGSAVDRFSDLLKDGGTAVTLEVDAKKSNSHMLVPGDFVDILVLTEKSKVEPTSFLKRLKQNNTIVKCWFHCCQKLKFSLLIAILWLQKMKNIEFHLIKEVKHQPIVILQ